MYPNALVGDDDNAIDSLAKSFNSEKTGDDTLFAQEILRDGYFDFSVLHNDKMVLKSNSLYDLLRKEGYKINVFQTGELDTCYVNNVLSVSSCVEKINTPITLIGEEFTTLDKLMVLLVQWIDSTGLVSTINPVLRMLEQIIPGLPNEFKAKNVELGKVYSYNSIRIFDKLVETIDRLSGNQAYFAIIDLPSDNFVYDEFCEVNLVNDWMSSHNVSGSVLPKSEKISAYARQTSCLYGRLQKFLVELNNMGILEDSTIVIQGLNSPADFIVKGDNFFKQIQTKRGVTFAVKNFEGVDEGIDYSVCSVPEIITSIFFNKKPCESYKVLNTSENNRNKAKSVVEADMFDKKAIDQATTFFNEWFKLWKTENGLETDVLSEPKHEPKVVDKSEVMDNVIEDVPEVKMESISSVEDVVGEVLDGQADEAVEKDTNVEDTTKDNVEEPSKLEKIAKITFDEISAKVDEVVKQRDTSNTDNVIEKINNIAGGLSKNIDDTFDNIGKKVAEVVRDSEPGEVVKEPEVEDIVTRTKKAILEKEANRLSDIKEDLEEKINAKNGVVLVIETEGNLDIKTDNEIVEKAYSQSKELRDILEAPVAEGQNLSPEELKKAYHEKLKNAAKKADIKIEVVE